MANESCCVDESTVNNKNNFENSYITKYLKQNPTQSRAEFDITCLDSTLAKAKKEHDKEDKTFAKSRWGKLKTSVEVTSNITRKKKGKHVRNDSFLRKFSTRNHEDKQTSNNSDTISQSLDSSINITCGSFVLHPSGALMFYWLAVLTLSVLYNLWTCIARDAFREIQTEYMTVWFCLDGFCDSIYICDILVQFRTGYLQQGLMVYETSKLCKRYLTDGRFIIDILCLLPLDFLQFYTGIHPMLRFPRFVKVYRCVRFIHMYESRTTYPNLLRVANLTHMLFLGAHWFAAFYYLISEAEGFGGDWSYPKPEGLFATVTRKYLASLFWSTLTLTTIGDLPPPDTNWQYVFVIVSYLIGVFVFATIVGQVGNVITNRNASRQEFEKLLDGAKYYMQMHNVPTDLQKRVQRWYDYVWTRGRLGFTDINSLELLPDKLKTELALHVNMGTLKKVTIFQKCRAEFLHDLMLKMRAYIFTPGDLVCRRGEVAREMFIIADGVVEILGDDGSVLTQMTTGDFFGEIGILNLDGGVNRRTADVRSVGYSELFVLSREDVLVALKDHPDAEEILTSYARMRLDIVVSQRISSEADDGIVGVNSDTGSCDSGSSRSSVSHKHVPFDSSKSDYFVQSQPSPSPSAADLRHRGHVTRNSSPSVLAIPATLPERFPRPLSNAPALDLPIEAPFTRGMRSFSTCTSNCSSALNNFKDTMERRLEYLEHSYKESILQLHKITNLQENMMKLIMKKQLPTIDKVETNAEQTNNDCDSLYKPTETHVTIEAFSTDDDVTHL